MIPSRKLPALSGQDVKKRRRQMGLLLLLALLAPLLLLNARYLSYVKKTIREDAKYSLGELGAHIAQSINADIQSTYNVLEGLRLTLPWSNISSGEEVIQYLEEQAVYWNFSALALVDEEGVWHYADGNREIPPDRELLSRALNKNETVYDFQVSAGEDCVIFITPLNHASINGQRYLAISGTYAIRNWDKLLKVKIYDGEANTYITTQYGVVISGPDNEAGPNYNFLETLGDARFETPATLSSLRQHVRESESYQACYTSQGEEFYLICSPIGFNHWALMFTVPITVVNSAGNGMVNLTVFVCMSLIILFILIFALFQFSQYRAKKALLRMAYIDEITGGPNKNKFELDARSLLSGNERKYTLVYMNICQFKLINSRYGKEEADSILFHLQKGIDALLTTRECGARLSADNFALLLETSEKRPVEPRLEEFAQKNAAAATSSGIVCSLRLAFGLYYVEDAAQELTQMVDRANLAMRNVSATGDQLWACYDSSLLERAAREKELTECLMAAITGGEFYICLQPKVELNSHKVAGAEALARWNSPRFGSISPGDFIPLAEKNGMICEIDWMVFEHVCRMLDGWRRDGRKLLVISFNLSKLHLDTPDFLTPYRQILSRYPIPPEFLEFEFTESLLYENTGVLHQAVDEIHQMGCRCSVDDFGFGYSSLGLLGEFEADSLKLDRSFFMRDADPDSRNNRIVKSVIKLAAGLGMQTVAEGIEQEEYVDMLRRFGCDAIQGYVFARPLPEKEFEQYVRSINHHGEGVEIH